MIFKDLSLSDRWIECDCGLSMDRDVNAAINLLKKAQNRDGQSRWELTWAVAPCVSQEAVVIYDVQSVTSHCFVASNA
jgi:transposase